MAPVAPFAWDDVSSTTRCAAGDPVRAIADLRGAAVTPLGRPVAFVGTPDEVGRNAFHLPPLHVACADGAARRRRRPAWQLVTTAGFEFVRPGREDDLDREPTFEPNSLLPGG